MRPSKISLRSLAVSFFFVAGGLLASCGQASSRSSGETHFLAYCSASCEDGFDCVCGVCTKTCSESASCGESSKNAECRPAGPMCGAAHCDVNCNTDADCKALSNQHTCREGSCRAGIAVETNPCDPGCEPLFGSPQRGSDACVDSSKREAVACACDGTNALVECRRRVKDDSLWMLPAVPLANAADWAACTREERALLATSCDFSSCATPPASICDRADSCTRLGCGGTQFDGTGCQRPTCEKDEDCATDERCVNLDVIQTGFCSYSNSGSCDCAGPGVAVSGAFCNPISEVGPRPLGAICDGSDDVRLALSAQGGFQPWEDAFMKPDGDLFVVDGKCRFYGSYGTPFGDGFRTGTLDPEQVKMLAEAARWADLPSWRSYTDMMSCPDAGNIYLLAPKLSMMCTCGCDETAPMGLTQALTDTANFAFSAQMNGTPLTDSPVTVVAESWQNSDPSAPIQDWPLTDSLESFLKPVTNQSAKDTGVTIEDPAKVTALRALRDVIRDKPGVSPVLHVRAANGDEYGVLIRDELPDGTRQAVDAFLAAGK